MIGSVSPVGVAPISTVTSQQTGVSNVAPQAADNFTPSYAPEIYTVYLNGLLSTPPAVSPAVLETNLYPTSIAMPPIIGNAAPNLPGAPPVVPSPQADGVQQIVAAVARFAGRTDLGGTTSGTVPTVAAGTGARQTSASSRSTSHVATK